MYLHFQIACFLYSISDNCRKENGLDCENGACLDNQCHCNDGYGGCSCEVPGKIYKSIKYAYSIQKG